MRRGDINITGDSIVKNLVLFVFPLICTNMLQNLYSAADMIVVGYSHVDGVLGSIGTTVALLNFILNVCAGLSIGTGIVVARRIGERNPDGVEKSVHTSIILSVVVGVILMFVSLFACPLVLHWMGNRDNILYLSSLYTKIYSFGIPFMSITNFAIAIFRAKGDTRTPLFVLSFSGALNVVLNLFFVLVLGMSVDGVAWATVLSTAMSSVVLLAALSRTGSVCRFSVSRLSFDRASGREILKNGIPSGFQGTLFSISNMMIQSCIITVNAAMDPGGSAIIDGNAAGTTVEAFANMCSGSMAQAGITFTSQHFGARLFDRMKRVIWDLYLVGIIITSIVTWSIILLREPILGIFIKDGNPLAMHAAQLRILIFFIPYIAEMGMELGSAILRGLDRAALSTTVTLVGVCGFRIIWIFTAFRASPTLTCILASYPISWAATALVHLVLIVSQYRRLRRAERRDENASSGVVISG